MKRFLYAVYDLKTEKELCLGVWDSVGEISRAFHLSPRAVYLNLYKTQSGRRFSKTGIGVYRIVHTK